MDTLKRWSVMVWLGLLSAVAGPVAAAPVSTYTDFDGDLKADLSVFHPQAGDWYVHRSLTASMLKQNWGWSKTLPVPADYDGDGKADLAVYDAESGNWYIRNSLNGASLSIYWSAPGVVPVPADFDGDKQSDLAVYLPESGEWGIRRSTVKDLQIIQFGWADAKALAGDFDGDGKADCAVYHSQKGDWYIRNSSDLKQRVQNWGWKEAYPVPADYDGDRKTDLAVFHAALAMWYIARSSDGKVSVVKVGTADGLPVPADYDGDGRAEPATYRQADGSWTIWSRATTSQVTRSWGWPEARAVGHPLWDYHRSVATVVPTPTNPVPNSADAIDVSKCVTLSKHRDVRPVDARITRKMNGAVIEGSNVRMSIELPLNWSTTTMSGKTVDGRCYIFWYEGYTLFGGHFDWHGLNQTVKTLKNIPGGYLDGKSPAKGAPVWFCLINREGDQRTNVVKCDNTWPGL